ncbi:MAG: hypothetical protein HQK49_15775 [Oligoflexia bacterium]|nr:hypothetical protein [Oligoflexia bacterium]
MTDICITGFGFINPMGNDLDSFKQNMNSNFISEDPYLKKIGVGIARSSKVKLPLKDLVQNKKMIKYMTRPAQMAEIAATSALKSAGINIRDNIKDNTTFDPFDIGLYMSVGLAAGDIDFIVPSISASQTNDGTFDINKYGRDAINKSNPLQVFHTLTNMLLAHVSLANSIKGKNTIYNSFVTGTGSALTTAVMDLQEGNIKYALVGGADDLCNFYAYTTYYKAGLIDLYHPYIPSEGAAFLVLESEENAYKRGAKILARIKKIHSVAASNLLAPEQLPSIASEKDLKKLFAGFSGVSGFEDVPTTAITSFAEGDNLYSLEVESLKALNILDSKIFNSSKNIGELGAGKGFFNMILPLLLEIEEKVLISNIGPMSTQYAFLLDYSKKESKSGNRSCISCNTRVVVTAAAVTSPLGLTVDDFYNSLSAGKCGISKIENINVSQFPVRIGGEIKNNDILNKIKKLNRLDESFVVKNFKDRKTLLTLLAIDQLLSTSMMSIFNLKNADICFSSGLEELIFEDAVKIVSANSEVHYDLLPKLLADKSKRYFVRTIEDWPAQILSSILSSRGVVSTNVSACAASTQAFGEAYQRIKHGLANVVIAGGVDSMLNACGLAGFAKLDALTLEEDPMNAIKPFDKNRNGTVLGEGATLLVLENLECVKAEGREKDILAEVIGYASTCDAYNVSRPDPSGEAVIWAMKNLLKNSKIAVESVDYINAHGTSTPLNDVIETKAIKSVFANHAYNKLKVSSTKSMIGHLVAAAGACEILATILSLKNDIIFPTINLNTRDPECDLDYVANKAIKQEIEIALSNSFGFGGQNAIVALKKWR